VELVSHVRPAIRRPLAAISHFQFLNAFGSNPVATDPSARHRKANARKRPRVVSEAPRALAWRGRMGSIPFPYVHSFSYLAGSAVRKPPEKISAVTNSHCMNPPIVMRSMSPPIGPWLTPMAAVTPSVTNTNPTLINE